MTAQIENLTCEYLRNPVGVDVFNPSLGWQIGDSPARGERQTAYRILVASSGVQLNERDADLWDSGRVESDRSQHIAYAGVPLRSGRRCFWKVMVWNKDGNPSPWSEPATWTMGLLKPEDWTAKWITHPNPGRLSHPWLRRTFEIEDNIDTALLHVNTPSYYEVYVNGVKATPHVLNPGISQVNKRFLVSSYDVASLLQQGTNCIAFWMGPGWYQPRNGNTYNAPVLRAQLRFETPSGPQGIGTDASWRMRESCISQIGGWEWADFGGEFFDAREYVDGWNLSHFDDADWQMAREIPTPVNVGDWEQRSGSEFPAKLRLNEPVASSWQACEAARLSDPIKPVATYELPNGKRVFDFGKPLTGWMQLHLRWLANGQEVVIEYADLDDNKGDRKLAHMPTEDGFQTFNQKDIYVAMGQQNETYCTRFNYHSFRYALVSGLSGPPDAADAVAMMIEPDVQDAGSFACSNELFNRIHEVSRQTFRTQNPALALGTGESREKSAYGDGGAHLTGYLYNFQSAALFRKWIRDWSDSQRADGWFRHTSPSFEDHGGGPPWGGQASALVRRMLLYYGDEDIVDQMYERLRRYVDYVESHTEAGILRGYSPTEREMLWMFIGDWVRPTDEPGSTFYFDELEEREFFNNCYRVLLWQELQDYAEATGRQQEAERCRDHLAVVRPLVHTTYFQADEGRYVFSNQGCLTIALYAEVPPTNLRATVLSQLEHEIVHVRDGHLNTGLLGTFLLIDLLIREQRNDLVALIMNQTTYPGWGFLIKELDVETWPETWSGWGSQVILVTATPDSWFFEGLAGIRPDPARPGFKHVHLRPGIVDSVKWVRCDYASPYGKIVSNWAIEGGRFEYTISIPSNSTATVHVPGRPITVNGEPITQSSAIEVVRSDDNASVFGVGAGYYVITSELG